MLADTALRMALRSMLNDLTYPEQSQEPAAYRGAVAARSLGRCSTREHLDAPRPLVGESPEPRRGSGVTQGLRRGEDWRAHAGRPRGQGH